MKIQITAKVETFVTMEVEVDNTNSDTLENAMNEVLENTDYSFNHESIVETEMVEQELSSHTILED